MIRYNPDIYHRHSIRLREYDYSQTGAYFVTVCTKDRESLFGEIVNGEMKLNDVGRMVESIWNELPHPYKGVETDEFVVMPNHFHGIIILVGAGPCACPVNEKSSYDTGGQPRGVAPTLSLPDIVHRFKSLTTTRYKKGVAQFDWPLFPGKLWQRNYYEHVIRNEEELLQIREYIITNPIKWVLDEENPNQVGIA
jgi:REP element-mobilizing transposase RayT